jgi:hypothetical protein
MKNDIIISENNCSYTRCGFSYEAFDAKGTIVGFDDHIVLQSPSHDKVIVSMKQIFWRKYDVYNNKNERTQCIELIDRHHLFGHKFLVGLDKDHFFMWNTYLVERNVINASPCIKKHHLIQPKRILYALAILIVSFFLWISARLVADNFNTINSLSFFFNFTNEDSIILLSWLHLLFLAIIFNFIEIGYSWYSNDNSFIRYSFFRNTKLLLIWQYPIFIILALFFINTINYSRNTSIYVVMFLAYMLYGLVTLLQIWIFYRNAALI